MFSKLFDLLDGAAALRVALPWIRQYRGAEARAMLVGLVVCDLVFGWLAWYFDIDTTMSYTREWHSAIMATLADSLLIYGPAILWIVTLAPTIIRQSMSGAAQRFAPMAWLIVVLNAFDMRTDWPRVRDLFETSVVWDLFSFAGPVQGLVWWLARWVMLLFATDLFEVCLLVCVACTIYALVGSVGRQQQAGARP